MTTKIATVLTLSLLLSACTLSLPSKNGYSSIQDAVTKQIALKCEYTDNGQTTTTYIKGKTVRLVGSDKSAGIEGLMKDNKFYLWNTVDNKDNKGMIIDISKMEGAKMGETPINSIDDVVAELEKKKENCTVTTDSDLLFELPSNIGFTEVPNLFEPTK